MICILPSSLTAAAVERDESGPPTSPPPVGLVNMSGNPYRGRPDRSEFMTPRRLDWEEKFVLEQTPFQPDKPPEGKPC